MSEPKTLLVATDGQAVLRSHDEGISWRRIKVDQDLEFDDCVRCLLPDPRDPHSVFAGAETGLFRSDDCGANCVYGSIAELNGMRIWKLVVTPDTRRSCTRNRLTHAVGLLSLERSASHGRRLPWKCRRNVRA